MQVTKRLRVRGHVQGVGFRMSLVAQARAQGVAGWVRNRRDGSVEALVRASSADLLEPLLAWVRHGPSAARVDAVEVEDLPLGSGALSGVDAELPDPFESRPTV